MRHIALVLIPVCLIIFLVFLSWGEPGKPQTDMDEIELKVRVLEKGNPMIHLKKEDFEISENNKRQVIIRFRAVQKKLNPQPKDQIPSRLFLLVFNIFNNNLQVQKSLDYIFNNILGKNDNLMMLINHKIIQFDKIPNTKEVYGKVPDLIKEESEWSKKCSEADMIKMDEFISYLRKNTENTAGDDEATRGGGKIHRHYYMKYFKSYLEKYVETIRTYNKKYLIPDINEYSRLLANIDDPRKETWIFYFFQMAELPVLSKKNRAIITKMKNDLSDRDWTEVWMDELDYSKKISNLLAEIDTALTVTADFETDPIINLLDNLNITFQSIFLNRDDQIREEYPDKSPLVSALKDKWKEIAGKTGGIFIDLEDLQSTLEPLEKTEDFYYTVTFKPFNQKIEKIMVTLPHHHYQVITSHPTLSIHIVGDQKTKDIGNSQIKIRDLSFRNRKLSITIANFSKEQKENKLRRRVAIRIHLKDSRNKIIYDKEKLLVPTEDIIQISIDFIWLPEGSLSGTVELTDLISGLTQIKFFRID